MIAEEEGGRKVRSGCRTPTHSWAEAENVAPMLPLLKYHAIGAEHMGARANRSRANDILLGGYSYISSFIISKWLLMYAGPRIMYLFIINLST